MIEIDERYCKGCGLCVHLCPKHALEISAEVNHRGFYPPRMIDASRCSNCGQCERYCPDFAIFIIEEESSADG